MPHVEGVVHEDERGGNFEPLREAQSLENPPSPAFHHPAESQDGRHFRELDEDRATGAEGKISGFAPEFRLDVTAQRTAALQPVEEEKRAHRDGDSDPGGQRIARHPNILRWPVDVKSTFAPLGHPVCEGAHSGTCEDAPGTRARTRGRAALIVRRPSAGNAGGLRRGGLRAMHGRADRGLAGVFRTPHGAGLRRSWRADVRSAPGRAGRRPSQSDDHGQRLSGLPPSHVQALVDSPADVALGPTEDGGFYAIACSRTDPAMFDAVHWSTSSALEDTIQASRGCGLTVELGPSWFDVDGPEDLARLG